MQNNERSVWADVARGDSYSSINGDACAYKNANGSISTGEMKDGVCTLPSSSIGEQGNSVWDTITHIADAANNIWGHGNTTSTTTNTPTPNNNDSGGGISALGVVGIIVGLGLVGLIIYKVAK